MEFEWDLTKELVNVRKHGVWFAEAVQSFQDSNGFQMADVNHSGQEGRFYWIGKSQSGRVLTTRFTRRGMKI